MEKKKEEEKEIGTEILLDELNIFFSLCFHKNEKECLLSSQNINV